MKKNIDDAVRFEEYRLLKVPLNRSMIDVRRLEVAIPQQTTPGQIEQIKRAIDYGQTKGVDVRITIVE